MNRYQSLHYSDPASADLMLRVVADKLDKLCDLLPYTVFDVFLGRVVNLETFQEKLRPLLSYHVDFVPEDNHHLGHGSDDPEDLRCRYSKYLINTERYPSNIFPGGSSSYGPSPVDEHVDQFPGVPNGACTIWSTELWAEFAEYDIAKYGFSGPDEHGYGTLNYGVSNDRWKFGGVAVKELCLTNYLRMTSEFLVNKLLLILAPTKTLKITKLYNTEENRVEKLRGRTVKHKHTTNTTLDPVFYTEGRIALDSYKLFLKLTWRGCAPV